MPVASPGRTGSICQDPVGASVPLVVIVGSTGTGKSALSLDLAQRLSGAGQPCEIVNADAMQLYRGMDVGTAKLPIAQRRGIPHHLLDTLDVTAEATVSAYQAAARSVIADILKRGALPILVGGSGLYVSAVVYDFQFPGTDRGLRARLEAELIATGPGSMYLRLMDVDPEAAARIGASNGRRLVRALEVVEITGAPHVAVLPSQPAYWRPSVVLGLRVPREELTPRLDARVDEMWRDGIVAEAEGLLAAGLESGVTASRAIGYAQALGELRGTMSRAEAIASTQQLTRRFARRQVSWFKRYPTHWIDADSTDRVEQAVRYVGAGAVGQPARSSLL